MNDWFSGTTLYWTPEGYVFSPPKTKLELLRDRCAPDKKETPKKPKPITDQDVLAIFDELLKKIEAAEKRVTALEDENIKLRRWARDKMFGAYKDNG